MKLRQVVQEVRCVRTNIQWMQHDARTPVAREALERMKISHALAVELLQGILIERLNLHRPISQRALIKLFRVA